MILKIKSRGILMYNLQSSLDSNNYYKFAGKENEKSFLVVTKKEVHEF